MNTNCNSKKSLAKMMFLPGFVFLMLAGARVAAQNTIKYTCSGLGVSGNGPLKCNGISEDDPNDLPECYSMIIAYMPGNNQHIELHFPAKATTYHLVQSESEGKNDSLSAVFYDNTNPNGYGHEVTVYPRDFTLTISRYDNNTGGVVEGTFSGTMQGSASGHRGQVIYQVNGSFHTTRTGQAAECRKLRRSEQQVCNSISQSLAQNLERPLTNAGWDVTRQNGGLRTIANHPMPYRPLMACSGSFDEKLSMSPNTEMGRKLDDSINYYRKMETKEDVMNLYRLLAMKEVKIKVTENSPFIKSEFSHGKDDRYIVLHVNGAGFACREVVKNSSGDVKYTTRIFLGNWQGADMNFNKYVNYPFVHKQAGPYIETLIFSISGPPAVADRLINSINWQGINAILSK